MITQLRGKTWVLAVTGFVFATIVEYSVAIAGISDQTVEVRMNDDVTLVATLALPADAHNLPTIIVRTPYGRHQHLDEARFWAENGYAVLVQDTRGKFDSGGEYIPFLNEHSDGRETLDWVIQQEWSNGQIGMWGSSYLAFCQLVLASTGHPALKSIIPISGWIHDEGQIRHGGANHIMLSIPWILHEESQTKRSMADYDLDELFEFLPLIDVFGSIGLESKIWNEEFDFSHLEAYSAAEIEIPVLHITGWNDFVCSAALGVHRQAASGRAGRHQKLMIGPWCHDQFYTTYTEAGDEDFGPASAMGRERLMKLSLDWFDMTLKNGAVETADWPQVRLFVMGVNKWRDYDSWPPPEVRFRKMYISSEKGANTLNGDGFLSMSVPSAQGSDTFVFDPMNPVPTSGGANFHFLPHLLGIKDQREIEERSDVLVYTSAPLAGAMEIIGPVKAVIYASTEGRDTDFTAKLVQVRTNGYARIIAEGIARASYRGGAGERELLEPGSIYRLTVELGSTAIVIPEGSRIRLEISSSNFPKYDRNPNTGEDPLRAHELIAVTQVIHHGGESPSHLVLPAVDKELSLKRRRVSHVD